MRPHFVISPWAPVQYGPALLTVEILYECGSEMIQEMILPESFPYSDDSFLLHSVVVPGAAAKNFTSTSDPVPNDWFTTRKKQVFIDSGIKIMFVGSPVLAQLVANGAMDEIRDVLEKSNPTWKAADSIDSDGQTLLHMAITQSRADLVQLLLEFEPDVEAQGRSNSTPLEAAAASGQALIVEILLARGASVEKSQSSTWGPIHLASGGGYLEVLRLLLLKKANVDALTEDGNTALHTAVEKGKRDCARLLLAHGAKPDIRNTDDRDTPLHIASALGDENMVKLLLQKGANKDIRNGVGKTAYDVAAEHGYTRLFDALRLGESLSIAARKGEVKTIQRLLQTGASINGCDQHGWTTLHRASFKGQLEAVRVLIEKGVDINARDEDGYSALLCAVEAGHVEIIEFLIKKGADVEVRTNKGVSALLIAESLQYLGVTRILIQEGATKDEYVSVNRLNSSSLGKGKDRVMDIRKKQQVRARDLRNKFDESMALAVV